MHFLAALYSSKPACLVKKITARISNYIGAYVFCNFSRRCYSSKAISQTVDVVTRVENSFYDVEGGQRYCTKLLWLSGYGRVSALGLKA